MDEIRFEIDCDTSLTHFHETLEILYVLSGRISVIMAGNSFTLNSEDFVVFNPYEHHDLYQEAGSHLLSVYISAPIVRMADIGLIRCCSQLQREQGDYFPLIRAKLAMLYKNGTDQVADRKLYILSEIYGLLAILKQQFQAQGNQVMVPEKGILYKILQYTAEHYSEDITLQSVADAIFLSRGHLSRVFQKEMGMPFSEYLRTLRLNKAARLLLSTELPVTDIALECGFSNTNTFIANFKQVYEETPGTYRKKMQPQDIARQTNSDTASIPLMNLLKHANYEERFQTLSKRQQAPTQLNVDVRKQIGVMHLSHRDSISTGWAEMLLHEDMRNCVRRAVEEIGFRYVTFQGILDDSMDVYHETEDGTPLLSFTYLDLILDFILSTGAKPCPIISYTPMKLVSHAMTPFGTSQICVPKNLDKWKYLVEGVMQHLIERYGQEEISRWRFSTYPAAHVSFGGSSMEEHFPLYRLTYESIRRFLPAAEIAGCQLDLDFMHLNDYIPLRTFLESAIKSDCIPDILSFQCFHRDYASAFANDVTSKVTARAEQMAGEPAPCSVDPDYLKHELVRLRSVLESYGLSQMPIQIIMWNSTIWQSDLGNDTCYKSAFLMKNYLDNMDDLITLSYSALTDNNERRVMNSNSFHGGFGLINFHGIPKAGYYAMKLLNKVGDVLLAQGNGYVVTCSQNRKKLQICLYHYCHYDRESHIDYTLPEEEQRSCDRYYGFENPGIRSFQFYISGLSEGSYDKETHYINRAQGSSYDHWMSMGAPKVITKVQQSHLEKTSVPGYQYEQVWVGEGRNLLVSTVLDAHEIRVICLEKK